MSSPSLSHPPIIQTVFGIKWVKTLSPAQLLQLSERYKPSFPGQKKKFEYKQSINPDASAKLPPPLIRDMGFVLSSTDSKRSLLLLEDSLAFSIGGPYSDWDVAIDQFYKTISVASDILNDLQVQGFFTRFVNLITCEQPFSVETYFKFNPFVPLGERKVRIRGLSTAYSLQSVTIPSLGATVRLFEKSISPISVDFVCDIEINKTLTMLCATLISDKPRFEEIRSFKNDIFFGSFTDTLLDQFGIKR